VVALVVVTSMIGGPSQRAEATHLTISGTVTGAGGAGLAGVLVYAYTGGSGATCCTPVTGANTASDGTYTLNVDAGTYRLRLFPGTGYIEEWYDNAPAFESALDVVVTTGHIAGIDAALDQGSKIAGTVTAAGGAPLAGIGVHAFNATQACCNWVTGTQTDPTGAYTLTLANGSYRLLFYVPSGAQLSEWFDDAADFGAATTLVIAGADLTGKNAQLATGQTISGTVTSSTSAPLADVFVGAFKNTTCCEWVAGTQTDASGNYTLAVANGTYRLMFYPTSGNALVEWWNDKPDFDAATPITVAGPLPGTNAQLGGGRLISGTVTSAAGGVALENVFVGAFKATGLCCDYVNGTGTDAAGKYALTVPDSAAYRLMFYPSDGTHLSEWWNNATSFELGTDIAVSGADLSGKDAVLAAGTKITGTVTASGGAPLASVWVGAYDATLPCCTWIAGSGTDSAGKYTLTVPSGSYKLMFYPFMGTSLSEWWDDKADFASATAIVVGGTSVTGKDAQLATGRLISGTVTAVTGGAALAGVGVVVLDSACTNWVTSASTDAAGSYAAVVGNGSYRVSFQPPPGYLGEWYDDKPSCAAATTLTVNNADLPGKNAALAAGKILSGTVTGGSGPLAGAGVTLFQGGAASCSPPVFVDGTATDGLGHYSFTVGAGDYRLMFSYAAQVAEWYDNKPDCASSTTVTVGATDVTGRDAMLTAVSGTVTDTNGAISGAQVQLEDATSSCNTPVTVNGGQTASNGAYAVYVPDGTYRLVFFATGHQFEYWDDKATCGTATTITVAGADVTGKNAQLAIVP
jgi:hypothetical protein